MVSWRSPKALFQVRILASLLEGKSRGVRKAGSAWMGARRALQSPFYTRRQVAGVKKNKKRGTQKF
ncbi:hypothetical protein A3B45_05525 [Candidatus Daviesbacteria bacterium RIFCSPLOWO2_01_FULL_39_12]|uniref:Uncharacterized protein n=1 Tax=Candidatus Daviesbacteria bacterium RIFCSPLOWO2_01_FULL_39_12 TaxID=1797785 RepID=A0A1F5KPI4_9BACT|nr:MAG: hypothetical protein A3B45_05525 [Candidatus Daviesbacteria bacterium RIFCSPLOWO2_01_FULL_39_12]